MIAVLSDFGNSDALGAMKGVIYSNCSHAIVENLFNEVQPHSIKEGAWVLWKTCRFYPNGTIFLCVVDPGVGGKRRAIAVQTQNYFFIGPDNGLMWKAMQEDGVENAVELSCKGASKTFHGRDVFAVAAGVLEGGLPLEDIGKPTKKKFVEMDFHRKKNEGEIVKIDRFGNIVTTIPKIGGKEFEVRCCKYRVKMPFYSSYEAAPKGKPFLIEGSADTLEVSLKNDSAFRKFRAPIGTKVEIRKIN